MIEFKVPELGENVAGGDVASGGVAATDAASRRAVAEGSGPTASLAM